MSAPDPANALQVAVVARLVQDADVIALSAQAASGPAVFAPRQPFDDVFPRTVIEAPQIVGDRATSTDELFVTLHHYAKGADASLKASELAGAARRALAADLVVPDFVVATQTYERTDPVGDPDETVEHIVSLFRFLVGPAA